MYNFSESSKILFKKIEFYSKNKKHSKSFLEFKSDLKKTLEVYFYKVNSIIKSNIDKNLKKEIIKNIENYYIDYFYNLLVKNNFNEDYWVELDNRYLHKIFSDEFYSYIINIIRTKRKKAIRTLDIIN